MTDATEVTTFTHWRSVARRVERETRTRHGASLPFMDIVAKAEHMIVIRDGEHLVVHPGWELVMRHVARQDAAPARAAPRPQRSPLAPTLGPRIRSIRQNAGWSQPALARACGFSRQTLATIEDGRTSNPRIQTLLKLADVLEVSLDALCGRGEEASQP
jgi:DNA-binding XRE family transcriptional regulator